MFLEFCTDMPSLPLRISIAHILPIVIYIHLFDGLSYYNGMFCIFTNKLHIPRRNDLTYRCRTSATGTQYTLCLFLSG
jgi:hypothetical protein